MLAGRTPLGAWHAVAAKVVATNRFRGVGGESCVEDFKIEELGGQSGKLVFGPVSVFNGQYQQCFCFEILIFKPDIDW